MNVRFAVRPQAGRGQVGSRRSGAILILFAALAFVLFAVAAVVIDVGLASLTQAQMQSATDSAALEGCRWRNFDEGLGDSNAAKRRKASAIVRLAFDDDLNPTQGGYLPDNYDFGTTPSGPDGADALNISAGPALRVSGGNGAWATNSIVDQQSASELARIDDPRLQPNNANLPNGDMIAGRFLPNEPHNESGSYARPDFTLATNGGPSFNALSFLVRMRRAGDANPADVMNNVSSSLPTLPLVFGMASTILQDTSNDWDPRRDGITVRSTSIASARPAMRVGRAPCDDAGLLLFDHEPDVGGTIYREHIAGLVPFFIYREAWVNHFRTAGWQANSGAMEGRVRVEPTGELVLDSTDTPVGHFMFGAAPLGESPCAPQLDWPEIVGRSVVQTTSTPVRSFRFTSRKPAYIAIVESIEEPTTGVSVLRVIGYGFAHLWPVGFVPDGTTPPPPDFAGTGTFVISPGELITHGTVNCWIAQDNASAILKSSANEAVGAALSESALIEVLRWSNHLAYGTDTPDPDRLYDYTYIQRGTVLAPALTR